MPTLKQRTLLAVAGATVAVLGVSAPTASPTASPSSRSATAEARGSAYLETRLFFGTERPDGGPDVTDAEFMAFVDNSVTPSFPSGLTIQDGRGQWRDSNGTIEKERSYELILLYPAAEAHVRHPQIERIREAYAAAYAQDSVARLDEPTLADF
ncbi:DUF3574 domain-containing protein [Streptomyces sp. NPDC005408]|uniref:DUF3574 domain-containing protein n=1 Tax=Streptomyces sp. NPDC005408 TaxID=3155341 RepID=UPI0033A88248